MGVTSLAQIGGKSRRRGQVTDTFVAEYSEFYRARTSANSDDVPTVLAGCYLLGLPRRFDSHPTDTTALVKSIDVMETDDPRVWQIEVRYSTRTLDETQVAENPLEEPAEIDYDSERYEYAVDTDMDGNAVRNSAGDPFENPITIEAYPEIVRYSDNIAFFDSEERRTYLGVCNSEVFWGQSQYTVLMIGYTAKRSYRNGYEFWRRNIIFKMDPSEDFRYQTRVDAGYRYRSSGVMVPAGANGETPAKPVLLNGSGGLLSTTATSTVDLEFTVRGSANFNDLNLEWVFT